jgi:hypothetical protein
MMWFYLIFINRAVNQTGTLHRSWRIVRLSPLFILALVSKLQEQGQGALSPIWRRQRCIMQPWNVSGSHKYKVRKLGSYLSFSLLFFHLCSAASINKMDVATRTPLIEVQPMSQRSEIRNLKEDWTGKTSTAERRKLQNRLNKRASSGFPGSLSLSCMHLTNL